MQNKSKFTSTTIKFDLLNRFDFDKKETKKQKKSVNFECLKPEPS